MRGEENYPVTGMFTSKRGVHYHYTVYSDHMAEIYKTKPFRKTGGWGKDKHIFVKPTKEFRDYILGKYGIAVR